MRRISKVKVLPGYRLELRENKRDILVFFSYQKRAPSIEIQNVPFFYLKALGDLPGMHYSDRFNHGLLGAFVGAIVSFSALMWLSDTLGWSVVGLGVLAMSATCSVIAIIFGEKALIHAKEFLNSFFGF